MRRDDELNGVEATGHNLAQPRYLEPAMSDTERPRKAEAEKIKNEMTEMSSTNGSL